MPKSELTKELEYEIWRVTHKQGVFCCYEVTIGWFGDQRVDYLTYDTKGIFRCYEIKVSKSDFHSKSHVTFVGHYNYYVMPQELYDQVKDEIPAHIGVYVGGSCVKKAKKQPLKVDEQVLKDSLIRSLSREVEKHIKSRSLTLLIIWKDKSVMREEELITLGIVIGSYVINCVKSLGQGGRTSYETRVYKH